MTYKNYPLKRYHLHFAVGLIFIFIFFNDYSLWFFKTTVFWEISRKERQKKTKSYTQIRESRDRPPIKRDKRETVTALSSHIIHKLTSSRLNLPSALVPTGPPVTTNAPFPIGQNPRYSKVICRSAWNSRNWQVHLSLVAMTGDDTVGKINCWLDNDYTLDISDLWHW